MRGRTVPPCYLSGRKERGMTASFRGEYSVQYREDPPFNPGGCRPWRKRQEGTFHRELYLLEGDPPGVPVMRRRREIITVFGWPLIFRKGSSHLASPEQREIFKKKKRKSHSLFSHSKHDEGHTKNHLYKGEKRDLNSPKNVRREKERSFLPLEIIRRDHLANGRYRERKREKKEKKEGRLPLIFNGSPT